MSIPDLEREVTEQDMQIAHLMGQFSDKLDVSEWRNIRLSEGGFLEASIPINQIVVHDFPINQSHADSLARQYQEEARRTGGTGQRHPIELATVIDDDGFHIVDGFHRYDAAKQIELPMIEAVLKPNMTREELIDERIAATLRGELELSRVVEMAQKAWELTPWASKLSVTEAFNMEANKAPGRSHGLLPEERALLSDWMKAKGAIWKLTAKQVYDHLKTASVYDPLIVSYIRTLGKKGDRGFTPAAATVALVKFTDKIDGEDIVDEDYVILIAETANRLELGISRVKALSELLYEVNDYEAAVQLCSSLTADSPSITPPPARPRHEIAPRKGGTGVQKSSGTAIHKPTTSTHHGVEAAVPTEIGPKDVLGIVEKLSDDNLLALLLRASKIAEQRDSLGALEIGPELKAKLLAVGRALLHVAAGQAEKWGHHGPYARAGQVHEAGVRISEYIQGGEGPLPSLPVVWDEHTRTIIKSVHDSFERLLPEQRTEVVKQRYASFVAEVKLRFTRVNPT